MPIPFTCPHCGSQTDVADQYAGRSGPCAQCGVTITVPAMRPTTDFVPVARRSSGVLVVVIIVVVLGVFLLCGGGLAMMFFVRAVQPARLAARQAATRINCVNNLNQIGLALHIYHETNGCFPPAYIPDENGQPMHSWRVLLLPCLEQEALYEQYDFDEPWDGPNNGRLADMIDSVYVYRCPDDVFADPWETSYVMIVGPGTFSDGPSARKISDIEDGTSNTIMVVEVAGSGIHWMEPRDLDAETLVYQIDQGPGPGIGGNHPGCANVLFCDGTVQRIDVSIDPGLLKDMTTIAGGEDVSRFHKEY